MIPGEANSEKLGAQAWPGFDSCWDSFVLLNYCIFAGRANVAILTISDENANYLLRLRILIEHFFDVSENVHEICAATCLNSPDYTPILGEVSCIKCTHLVVVEYSRESALWLSIEVFLSYHLGSCLQRVDRLALHRLGDVERLHQYLVLAGLSGGCRYTLKLIFWHGQWVLNICKLLINREVLHFAAIVHSCCYYFHHLFRVFLLVYDETTSLDNF